MFVWTVCMLAYVAGYMAWQHRAPGPFETDHTIAQATPSPMLRDSDGRSVTLAVARQARAALVFFGYTHCTDVCPATLHRWAQVRPMLGVDTSRIRFVFIGIDGARDDGRDVQRYVRQFDPTSVGLSGSAAEVRIAESEFGVRSTRAATLSGEVSIAHSDLLFLVGADGRLHDAVAADLPIVEFTTRVRALLN